MTDVPAKGTVPERPALVAEDTPALEVDENADDDQNETDVDDTTSIASSLLKGHIENGRRFSSLRDDYWGPSDEQQFETMDAAHFVYLLLLSDHENMLFRSPISPKRVLDVGTGPGTWAIDTADQFPEANVRGVDLFPPPRTWMPPNCVLEVEDISKEWTWKRPFDLIHIRYLLGAFTDDEWVKFYQTAYDNLEPGGWIEQLEPDCRIMSDDGSVPEDSHLTAWGPNFFGCAERSGRSIKIVDTMRRGIERAGFINVQEDYFKVPIGPWAKDLKLKEVGRMSLKMWTTGLEGFAMFLLTKFGAPKPWTQQEVLQYTSKVREEFQNPKYHKYHYTRRVWAQKPPVGHAVDVA